MIDEAVEKTDDYQKRICEELGIVTQTWISHKPEHHKIQNIWK
jgi:hypothetical protein